MFSSALLPQRKRSLARATSMTSDEMMMGTTTPTRHRRMASSTTNSLSPRSTPTSPRQRRVIFEEGPERPVLDRFGSPSKHKYSSQAAARNASSARTTSSTTTTTTTTTRCHWKRLFRRGLGLAVLLRLLWYAGVLHSRVLTTATTRDWTTSLRQYSSSEKEQENEYSATQQRIRERQRTRQSRVRANFTTNWEKSNNNLLYRTETPQQPQVVVLTPQRHYNWTALCAAAGLDRHSRVVIANALTSLGPSLAALFHHQCHVQQVALIDPFLWPNQRRHRMQVTHHYLRHLFRHNRHLQLHTNNNKNDLSLWLPHFRPTHSVLLPPSSSSIHNNKMNEYMSAANQRLYLTQSQLLLMDQLLEDETSSSRFLQILLRPSSSSATAQSTVQRLQQVLYNHHARNASQLVLPAVFGPAVVEEEDDDQVSGGDDDVYVADALAAILRALEPRSVASTLQVVDSVNTISKDAQLETLAWKLDQVSPYTIDDSSNNTTTTTMVLPDVARGAKQYRDLLGIQRPNFPCASSCRAPTSTTCTRTVWDDIIPVSRMASNHCVYVVYMFDFSPELQQLPIPQALSSKLCRIAFVSSQSPLVRDVLQQRSTKRHSANATKWNGKVAVDGWRLVWVTVTSDEDMALPTMDPSRLFGKTVLKAFCANQAEFSESPDPIIYRIIRKIDRPAQDWHMVRQTRPGHAHESSGPSPSRASPQDGLFCGRVPPHHSQCLALCQSG